MEIRKATPNDARRISYLIQKNTERVVENGYSQAQIEVWKRFNAPSGIRQQMEKRILFCAFENQKLVGTIGLQDNEVVGLYVSYSQRKKGIGGILLDYLERYARNQKIEKLTLSATPSARRFYEKRGFISLKPVVVNILGVYFFETEMCKIFP